LLQLLKNTLLVVGAIFPIVNPLGGSPIFLAVTRDYTQMARRLLSRRIALNSFFLLTASFLVGTNILAFFGISIPVVQVGGGLIVMSTGWTMLKQKDEDDRRNVNRFDVFRKAFYPLTLSLTVGPGSISVAITLGANLPHTVGGNILAIVAAVISSALVALSVYLCYGFADHLAQLLGSTAMSVILRLSSFLLVCIGVQIVWNGARALLATLPVVAH